MTSAQSGKQRKANKAVVEHRQLRGRCAEFRALDSTRRQGAISAGDILRAPSAVGQRQHSPRADARRLIQMLTSPVNAHLSKRGFADFSHRRRDSVVPAATHPRDLRAVIGRLLRYRAAGATDL